MAKIEHVSDTALMVAACRAIETERPDGLIRDDFAAKLAGEKGMAIAHARGASALEVVCFGIGVRSRFIDELLALALRPGRIETVVNLGAGLDTRPWRLDLAAGLRWIEVDFASMLDYKSEQLNSEPPRCALDRIPADLSSASDREKVYRAIGDRPALMLTEGLLMYLPRPALMALCSEPAANCGARWWIFDASSTQLMERAHGDWMRDIDHVRAEDHLNGAAIIEAARAAGWNATEVRSYIRDAITLAPERIVKLARSSERKEAPPESDPSGVYLCNRSS